jgi:transposase
MGLVEGGKITLKEASEKIGVSYRQAKRIRKAVKLRGAEGVIHGNTGCAPINKIAETVRQQVLRLSRERYWDLNDVHLYEKLKEEEKISLSRETVRKIRREASVLPKRRRRGKKHRKRRERMAQEGWMVLWDGSPHLWFGPERPPCCLMAAMDDATGKIVAAQFFPFEGTAGYLWLLRNMIQQYGIPVSIYQDRHGSLHRNDEHWSLEEQLAGRQEPTQVGLALEALGIRPIFALSPQAKGRMERAFGILQDRLIAELRLAGVTNAQDGNLFLKKFLKALNRKFSISPRDSEKAWRELPAGVDLDRITSIRYHSVVGNDNAVRLGGLVLDIAPGPGRRSYAKEKVEVRQLLDGSWRVYYRNQVIAKHRCTALEEPIRTFRWKKDRPRATRDYEWVYRASTPPMANP